MLTPFTGLGSVISPIVCQTIIAAGVPWTRFYYGSLVISAITFLFLACTYMPTTSEFALERQQALDLASDPTNIIGTSHVTQTDDRPSKTNGERPSARITGAHDLFSPSPHTDITISVGNICRRLLVLWQVIDKQSTLLH